MIKLGHMTGLESAARFWAALLARFIRKSKATGEQEIPGEAGYCYALNR